MELTYEGISVSGPVRPNNEDNVGFWQPDDPEQRRDLGLIAAIADGVGGHNRGEVASALAIKHALEVFSKVDGETDPGKILRDIFNRASQSIYDEAMRGTDKRGMCTTLSVSVLRHNQITVGYVGDSRVYVMHAGNIQRLTTDHSLVGFQSKYGLIREHHAMTSPSRSQLTRSLGTDPICRFDVITQELFAGDVVVQCTDGLYTFATDSEIWDIACHEEPRDAVKQLLRLVEKRNGDDNVSIQIMRVNRVHRAISFRGVRTGYQENAMADNGNELQDGSLLDSRFRLVGCVNRSGMASIYKAIDLKTDEYVAIKVPHRHLEADVASFSRFEREEQIGKSLNHPSVLKFISVEGSKSRPYLVMEFLEGQTLAEYIQKTRPVPEPEAARIASRICDGLNYLHQQNVIHRDLKPANIMLCADGSIRIMDFGIAKSAQARRMTFVGFTPSMGTPDYMAPEQVQGKRGDERTDIYSLGAILYEMATGSVMFEGENPYVVMNSRLTGDTVAPRKVNPNLTPVLEEIILHALERNPANRFHSAAQMKAELDDYEKVELTSRWQRLKPPQLWRTRFRWVPIIAGIVVLQILLFLLLWWTLQHKGGRH